MQFISKTYALAFFKTFRPQAGDSLSPIEERFVGKKIIGISIGRRIKVGIIEVKKDGERVIQSVTELNADAFPGKPIPATIHSELRALAKLGHAIVTVSDFNQTSMKVISGSPQDNEEATMISLSADPKAILNVADSASSHRLIQGEKASAITAAINTNLISQIESELALFRIQIARVSHTPMSCFDILLAHPDVVEKNKIPLVIDAGTIYTMPFVPNKEWGNIRTLHDVTGSHYEGSVDKASQWLLSTVIPMSAKVNGPQQFIAIDAGTSGEVNFDRELDVEFVDFGSGQGSQHIDLITSSYN